MSSADRVGDIPPFPDFPEFQAGYADCLSRFQGTVAHLSKPPCPPSCGPLPQIPLEMLDLLGIRRASYSTSLVQQLCRCLRREVESAHPALLREIVQRIRLEELIRMSVPELGRTLFDLLLHMETVDEMYLRMLASEPDFLDRCPLQLKQLVWELEEHKSLFSDSVSPLLDEYIEAKERVLSCSLVAGPGSGVQTFFSLAPEVRRGNTEVQRLLELVGGSYKLYNTLCIFIRILFSKTRKPHFCTLRCDLVTALERSETPASVGLLEQESCRQFISLLDQAQAEARQGGTKLVEIHKQFRAVKRYMSDSYETLFDLVMALRDPHAVHMLCRMTLEHAFRLSQRRRLPRQSNEVLLTLHLLNIALHALAIIDKRMAPEPSLDPLILSLLLPDLMLFMQQEKVSLAPSSIVPVCKLGQIPLSGAPPPFPFSPDSLRLLEADPVANALLCCLVIQVARRRDVFALLRLLPVYAEHHSPDSLPELFFHELSSYLLPLLSQLPHSDLQEVHGVVFGRFWAVFYPEEDAFRHACRLIRGLCQGMPPERLINLLEEMGRVYLSTEKMTDEWSYTIHFISDHSSVPLSFFNDGADEPDPHNSSSLLTSTMDETDESREGEGEGEGESAFVTESGLDIPEETLETEDNEP